MTSATLVTCQLFLEGITFDARGRLVARSVDGSPDIPRFYVARQASGVDRFYRADLPDSLVARLAELPPDASFDNVNRVKNLLHVDAPCRDVWVGSSYTFPEAPPSSDFPDVRFLTDDDRGAIERFDHDLLSFTRPIQAILVEGEIGSTCVSARENDECAEAWVQTAPAFRRRGFGRQVTAAWGSAIVKSGKTAFYSHARTNSASRGIATSLGLSWFLDAAGYL